VYWSLETKLNYTQLFNFQTNTTLITKTNGMLLCSFKIRGHHCLPYASDIWYVFNELATKHVGKFKFQSAACQDASVCHVKRGTFPCHICVHI
jgi:hypothetical protein